MNKFLLNMAMSAAVVPLIPGCAEQPAYVQSPPPAVVVPAPEVVVAQPPPPVPREVIVASPGPAFVWVPGYWGWQGRWVWVGGAWRPRPYPRAVWVSGRWVRRGSGWVWVSGRWR